MSFLRLKEEKKEKDIFTAKEVYLEGSIYSGAEQQNDKFL